MSDDPNIRRLIIDDSPEPIATDIEVEETDDGINVEFTPPKRLTDMMTVQIKQYGYTALMLRPRDYVPTPEELRKRARRDRIRRIRKRLANPAQRLADKVRGYSTECQHDEEDY